MYMQNALPHAPCMSSHAMPQAAADAGRGVHAIIVPTEDPHMSEYSPDCFKRREFISRWAGFRTLVWGRAFRQACSKSGAMQYVAK